LALSREEFLKYQPSFEERVETQAKRIVLNRRAKEEKITRPSEYMRILDWLGSVEGQKELFDEKNRIKEILPQVIT